MNSNFLIVMIAVLAICFAAIPALAVDDGSDAAIQALPEVYVDAENGDDFVGDGTAENPFATIGKGIEMVAAGGTVYVAAGEYEEQVLIEKSLTLLGADGAIIAAPPAEDRTSYTIPYSERTFDPIVFARPPDPGPLVGYEVAVSGFEIDGKNDRGSNDYVGILFSGLLDAAITANDVHSLMSDHITLGIAVYGGYDVEVSGNSVKDFRRNAISVFFADSASVEGNTVTGKGYTRGWAQNGIQLWDVEFGTVKGNILSEIGWIWDEGTEWVSTGILLYEGINYVVTDNVLTNVQLAIYGQFCGFEAEGNEIYMLDSGELNSTDGILYYSTFEDDVGPFAAADQAESSPSGLTGLPDRNEFAVSPLEEEIRSEGNYYHLQELLPPLRIQDNLVIGDYRESGVAIWGIGVWPRGSLPLEAEISENVVLGWYYGIDLWAHQSLSAEVEMNQLEDNLVGLFIDTYFEAENFSAAGNLFKNNRYQVYDNWWNVDLDLILAENSYIPKSVVYNNMIIPLRNFATMAASFYTGTWWYSAYYDDWDSMSMHSAIACAYADMTGDGSLNLVTSYPSGTWYLDEEYAWIRLTTSVASALAGDGNKLYASFRSGTWIYYVPYDEPSVPAATGIWEQLAPSRANALTVANMEPIGLLSDAAVANGYGYNLVASFKSGTWYLTHDGEWVSITPSTAVSLAGDLRDTILLASYSSGTWYYDVLTEEWGRLTPSVAKAITYAEMPDNGSTSRAVVFSFTSGTWYRYVGVPEWFLLTSSTAHSLAGKPVELVE